jgi:HSP20 family protein
MTQTATKVPLRTEHIGTTPPSTLANWRPFDNLRREVDRIFDNFHEGFWATPSVRSLFDIESSPRQGNGWSMAPVVDVAETDQDYEVTAELPGMDAKDIEVKFAHDTLTIKGEKKEEKEEKKKDYYLSERRYGSFQRSFQTPDGIDPDKIEANFEKGVLKVKLPKSAKARTEEKTIAISTR